jgi:hypothetical protein
MIAASHARRFPESGWIAPSPSDRIINDARDGLDLDVIFKRAAPKIDSRQVISVLRRAYSHGFITPEEAMALGLLAKDVAA